MTSVNALGQIISTNVHIQTIAVAQHDGASECQAQRYLPFVS